MLQQLSVSALIQGGSTTSIHVREENAARDHGLELVRPVCYISSAPPSDVVTKHIGFHCADIRRYCSTTVSMVGLSLGSYAQHRSSSDQRCSEHWFADGLSGYCFLLTTSMPTLVLPDGPPNGVALVHTYTV
jgi:hypothetical protein